MKIEKGKYSCSYFKLWAEKIYTTPGKYDKDSGKFTQTGSPSRSYSLCNDEYDLDNGIEVDDIDNLCNILIKDILPAICGTDCIKNISISEIGSLPGEYVVSWVSDIMKDGSACLYEMETCVRFVFSYELKNSNDFVNAFNEVLK